MHYKVYSLIWWMILHNILWLKIFAIECIIAFNTILIGFYIINYPMRNFLPYKCLPYGTYSTKKLQYFYLFYRNHLQKNEGTR